MELKIDLFTWFREKWTMNLVMFTQADFSLILWHLSIEKICLGKHNYIFKIHIAGINTLKIMATYRNLFTQKLVTPFIEFNIIKFNYLKNDTSYDDDHGLNRLEIEFSVYYKIKLYWKYSPFCCKITFSVNIFSFLCFTTKPYIL